MALSLCGGANAQNVGGLACDKSRGVLKKLLIFNGTISGSDLASEAAFFSKLVSNSKLSKSAANKVFPLAEAQEIANNSESDTTGTLGLGFTVVLREGKPVYNVKILAGADELKRLRKFNNQTVRIIEYDANGTYWLTKQGANAVGFQAKLVFKGNFLANGTEVSEGVVDVTISVVSTSEYIDNAYYVTPTGNVEDIVPLIDVNLVYVSNSSNVFKYKMQIPGSNLITPYDIWSEYGAAIAALTFTAKGDGSALTVTSVAADNTLGALTVTYDSSAYASLGTGKPIELIPPSVATLDAADATGIELLSVVTNKPA